MIGGLTSSKLLVILTLFALLASAESVKDSATSKWRILALEGGGDIGSFQAGAIKAFVELLDPIEVQYDVVTGVSVGAINSIAIALHEKGQEKDVANWMSSMWFNLTQKDIYQGWPLGMTQGLFFKEGLYNNGGEEVFLARVMQEFTDKRLKRKWVINTVDLDTGEVVHFNESSVWELLPRQVVASTSMPFAFTHTHLNNKTYVDGGSVWNIEISKGIDRCLETHDLKDIIVDVMLWSSHQVARVNDTQKYKTVQNYARYNLIREFYSSMSDIDEIVRGYPDVEFRYWVYPTEALPSGFLPLGFNHDDMVQMMNFGYEDAKKVITGPQSNSFCDLGKFKEKQYNVYNPKTVEEYKKRMSSQL